MTVFDQGHGVSRDPKLVKTCRREDRNIVTFDTDFADLREYPPRAHPRIVVFRLESQARDHRLDVGARFLRLLTGNPHDGQVWIMESTRVRFRE